MTRNLKILVLALIAVLAASVVASSVTQATDDTPEFTAGKDTKGADQKIHLTGSGTDESFHSFGVTGTCDITAYGPNPATVTVPAKSLTIKPYHKLCTLPKVKTEAVTVVTNKCGFRFNVTNTAKDGGGQPIPDTYNATMDIECENANEAFELKVWLEGNDPGGTHENAPSCISKVTAQTGRPGVTIKVNTQAGARHDLKISGTVKNIHVHQVRNSAMCPLGTTTATAEYTFPAAGATLEASTEGGEDIDLWID